MLTSAVNGANISIPLRPHCGVAPGDELLEQATPALAWLAEQDEIAEQQSQHDAAVAELDDGFAETCTAAKELIRKHNAARANGFALSERLVDAVKDRLAAMERAKTLKRRMLIGGISLSILLIAGLSAAHHPQCVTWSRSRSTGRCAEQSA